jgi:hypothetical protein
VRFLYFVACLLVAFDTVDRAVFPPSDSIFSPEFAWLNWPIAVLWLAYGIYAFFWQPEHRS